MTNEEAIIVLNDPVFWDHLWRVEQEEAIEVATNALEQQKDGKWLFSDKETNFLDHFVVKGTCSVCAFKHDFVDAHTAQYQYCPSCGARMNNARKESEHETSN